jgi:5'-deoxynucleotidase YfbR-like HD superfamily hydrolase
MSKTTPILTELDDRLSIVKRWVLIRTNRSQSVAEHCFNVQRICMRISPWFSIYNSLELFRLSQAALHHDDNEALTGDIPWTARDYVKKDENRIDTGAATWYNSAGDRIKAIVKLADLLEAYHFLTMEMQTGNWYLVEHKVSMRNRIMEFISEQGWDSKISAECDDWMSLVETTLSQTFGENRGSITSTEDSPKRSTG